MATHEPALHPSTDGQSIRSCCTTNECDRRKRLISRDDSHARVAQKGSQKPFVPFSARYAICSFIIIHHHTSSPPYSLAHTSPRIIGASTPPRPGGQELALSTLVTFPSFPAPALQPHSLNVRVVGKAKPHDGICEPDRADSAPDRCCTLFRDEGWPGRRRRRWKTARCGRRGHRWHRRRHRTRERRGRGCGHTSRKRCGHCSRPE